MTPGQVQVDSGVGELGMTQQDLIRDAFVHIKVCPNSARQLITRGYGKE
jgi:hypothetical protein